ncbi:Transcriptional regulator containing PAS, AAA-type ATPase, and DNA-binding Fis domains [Cohaesibacter sp. ES.047]|uniref:sigma 54-interacting transcriptional regulator n=1 Tax=Cohaesibacter sp. ES.047 TaxID=1798205 RepID=UPI000BC0E26D|nr:sigma 54-interacting transcriptional regulator [Cohaesibacter sp. ES.047]SNY92951.1 Transcriptional regulator containing PAS, AAA-type ATPase, and DNA-binding Fis domains [Cohaesibacter sp. ES.047]
MVIAFIAPYEQIRVKAQSIIDTSDYPAKAFEGDLQQGVKAARQAMENGAKIIISRGGTARMIRRELDVEVIEVEASVQRTLAYIHKETDENTRIAVAGFAPLINLVEPICTILTRTYRCFELREKTEFQERLDSLVKWKPDVVIGDAVACQWVKSKGLNAYLIESSMETIVDAFERAMLVYKNLNRYILAERKLSTVLDCTRDGAVLVNKLGRIEEVNRQGCEILAHPKRKILGAAITDFFVSPELERAFQKSMDTRNMIVSYRGDPLALDHITIASGDFSDQASVVLFQPVQKIQDTGNVIRKKLTQSGFYAKYSFSSIHYRCQKMKRLVEMAQHYSQTTCNIMIVGETGTGKELFAQSIHNAGQLADGPFVAVNCAALPGDLLESELFGYAPGAFTGASKSGKIGLFELAHEGTLFLDELTEMNVFLQAKLLRALQTGEIMRIGDNKVVPINVRIIATTNKVPQEEIKLHKLRADLFYRLNVLDLSIPALRERDGDAELLFKRFLEKSCQKRKAPTPHVPTRVLKQLKHYSWPGNVRELENFAEKYATLQSLSDFEMPALSAAALINGPDRDADLDDKSLDEIIASKVHKVYQLEDGNITRTAQRLAIDRNTVKRWLMKSDKDRQQNQH